MLKHTFNKKAFTLVELLIVIVIIGILFVALISRLDFTTDKSKGAGVQSDLKSYATAATSAAIAYVGFSEDSDTLMHNLNRFLDTKLDLTLNGGSLETSAQDPWGTDYIILVARPEGTFGELTFISAGPDRDYFTNDDQAVTVVCTGAGLVNTTFPMKQAHNHHFEAIETGDAMKVAASCTRPAVYYYSCKECKMKNNDEFEAGAINPNKHLHTTKEYMDNGDPATHVVTTKCTDCNGILHSNNEPHGEPVGGLCTICGARSHTHVFDQIITDSGTLLAAETCTSPAVYYKSCSCGQKGSETFTFGSALGHDFTEEKAVLSYLSSNATCNERAKYYKSCSRCGLAGTETFESGGFGSHKYNQQVVSTEYISSAATCTLPAKYFHSCACGEKGETTFMSGTPNGHQYMAATCTLPQTCTVCHMTSGSVGGHHEQFVGQQNVHSNCSVCGVVIKANHTFGSEITTPATCTEQGITTYTCLCGYSYTEQNVAKDFDNHSGIPTNGGDAGVHSKYSCCNQTISTEHQYVGTVIDSGNCTTKGWTKYECSCGYYYTAQDVSSSVHVFDQEKATNFYLKTPANCGGSAIYYKSCVCGEKGVETFESGSSNLSNHIGEIVSGGEENKHTKYSCCGEVASPTHSYTPTTQTIGTCNTKAVIKYTCSCGYFYTQETEYAYSNHSGTVVNGGTVDKHTKYSCCDAVVSSTHSYSSSSVGNTCSGMTTTYTCGCGYSYNTSTGGNGHTYGAASYSWRGACTSCVAMVTCSGCGHIYSETGTVYYIDKNNYTEHALTASSTSYDNPTCRGYRYDYVAYFDTLPADRCDDWHYYGTADPNGHVDDSGDDYCDICSVSMIETVTWIKYNTTVTHSSWTAMDLSEYAPQNRTIGNSANTAAYIRGYNPCRYNLDGSLTRTAVHIGNYTNDDIDWLNENMVGLYDSENWLSSDYDYQVVWRYNSFYKIEGGFVTYNMTYVQGVKAYKYYNKGSSSYGTVNAAAGSLPSSGTLVRGGIDDGYCVMYENGTYYYYELS
jgi:prepilin-type N-terminal cleavage/methylation domain-containing protein